MTVRYVITCIFQISFIQICTQLLGPNTFNFKCLCIIFKSICDDEVEISVDLLSQVLTAYVVACLYISSCIVQNM